MRIFLISLLGLFVIGSVFAKDYTVKVDDKIVPYFEKALDDDITPEEWLALQVLNQADRNITVELKKAAPKSRDEKIAELEKDKEEL